MPSLTLDTHISKMSKTRKPVEVQISPKVNSSHADGHYRN